MPVSRRTFLGAVPAALAAQSPASARLDRRDIVSRHNPTLRAIDPRSPLSVGNGEFAFTADPTGLQTFPQPYLTQMPLCTQSQWGWHTAPNPTGKGPADLRLAEFDTFGRKVGYPTSSDGQKPLFDWLRENPHRLHLGRIGFAIDKPEDVRFIAATVESVNRERGDSTKRGQAVTCMDTGGLIHALLRSRLSRCCRRVQYSYHRLWSGSTPDTAHCLFSFSTSTQVHQLLMLVVEVAREAMVELTQRSRQGAAD